MCKRKRSDRASGRPRRPSPESNDGQSEGEEFPSTPDEQPDMGHSDGEEFPSTPEEQPDNGQSEGGVIPSTSGGQPGSSTGQRRINTQEDGLAFLLEVKEYFKGVEPGKYTAFVALMLAQKRERCCVPCLISQVKELFRGHPVVLKLFNEILQPQLKIIFKEDVPEIQDLSKLYMTKVKTRSLPLYTIFLHILYLYNERALTSDEVDQEVEVLFAGACDLLEEYDCFRPDRAAPVVQSPLHPRHSALQVSELEREQHCERIQRMCEDVAKRKRKGKGKGVVTEREQQEPPKRVSARLANAANALGNRRSSRSSVEAHSRRPTRSAGASPAAETQSRSRSRGLDYAKYNQRSMCTPSYLLLKPPNNVDGECEVPAELAKSVLNEECELVRVGDSQPRTLNPHEMVLFTCERDQYECDMIWKRMEVTTKSFMNYLIKLQGPNSRELPPVEELLSAMHIRCIQQLYDRDAQAFIASLKENLAQALPILLNRLVLKMEELRSFKEKADPEWSQVYINNFHLSLDHQSVDSQPLDRRPKVKLTNASNLEAGTSALVSPSASASPIVTTSPRRSGNEGSETNTAEKMVDDDVSESTST